jgi:glycosyltransferase involved in cell wall biosynthesis
MATLPHVSIIMPAYNASATIAESIRSVLNQSYANWELIIVDDGSRDNTVYIANNFAEKEKRIVLLKLSRNGGLSNARNEGWRIARGEFIAFLDSDDLWHEDKLEKQIRFHQQNPNIGISHTDFKSFKDGKVIRRPLRGFVHLRKYKYGKLYPEICYKNSIGVLTVMVRKSLLESVDGFDVSLWGLEDQDLWIRIAMKNNEFGYIDESLALYRITETGMVRATGKYKRAYKKLIYKTSSYPGLNMRMAWRYYYRYFGTAYFKKSQMKLAQLYFWQSLVIVPFDFISASTIVYMFVVEAKLVFANVRKVVDRVQKALLANDNR